MSRLCLNMIVKNEAARIERCLASVAPHIACWCILDTGSVDGTPEIIRDFFGSRHIHGHVFNTTFVDFSTTRNEALAFTSSLTFAPHWDYVLLMDADMELVAPDGFGELTAAGYLMLQRGCGIDYWNTRLLRRDVGARYRGLTHEYLEVDAPVENLPGPWFIDHADGANRPGKFERDIALLERSVAVDPNDARSWFYLGQSHRDAGHLQDAIRCYDIRASMGGWSEEVWYSRLAASRCQRALTEAAATDAALRAFGSRPGRSEPLADLSRHYRELGLNEVALMFAKRGLAIAASGDPLFVEDSRAKFREDIAICGFYSTDPETRKLAAEVCDGLALDRNVSRETRDLARRNLYWYMRPVDELLPSWRPRRLAFAPPDGYRQMAPSVTRFGNRLVAAQRCINYWIDEGGYNTPGGTPENRCPVPIHSRTFLLELDPDTLTESCRGEVVLPPNFPPPLPGAWVRGFEDLRIFEWSGELWGIATVRDQSTDNAAEQWLARIGSNLQLNEARPIFPQSLPRQHEKNWMPVVDGEKLRFVYLCDPTRILDEQGNTVAEHIPEIAADDFRGNTQLVPFDGGWLAAIHTVTIINDWRKYRHRFVWFDSELRLQKAGPAFVIPSSAEPELLRGYQFLTGMCWHPDERRLVIGYALDERESWVTTVEADDMRQMLGLSAPADAEDIGAWVASQTNRALQHVSEIDRATAIMKQHGLPQHASRSKNWDTYLALWHCYNLCSPEDSILDAAGTRESAFLPALARLGYKHLLNINLHEPRPIFENGVSYAVADITNTKFADGAFRFVLCQSVLEHNIEWRAWVKETARITASGGHVFVSVDYWESALPRNRWGMIFTPEDVAKLIGCAEDYGLRLDGSLDYRCYDKVINWEGQDYTFLNFLLRRD